MNAPIPSTGGGQGGQPIPAKKTAGLRTDHCCDSSER